MKKIRDASALRGGVKGMPGASMLGASAELTRITRCNIDKFKDMFEIEGQFTRGKCIPMRTVAEIAPRTVVGSTPFFSPKTGYVSSSGVAPEHTFFTPRPQFECQKCERKEETSDIRAKSEPGVAANSAPGIQSRLPAAKDAGAPMEKSARQLMETAFGRDFGHIRIHTGSGAAQMNRELNARAFTYGPDIYFNTGQYNPASRDGIHLLSHEIVHVEQQRRIAKAVPNRKIDGTPTVRPVVSGAPDSEISLAKEVRTAGQFEGDPMKWNYNLLQEALECMAQVEIFHTFLTKNLDIPSIRGLINFVKARQNQLLKRLLQIGIGDALTILDRLNRCASPYSYKLNESDLNASEQLYDLINFFWNHTKNSRNYWGGESAYISLPQLKNRPPNIPVRTEGKQAPSTPQKMISKESKEQKIYFLNSRKAINDLLRYFNKKGYDNDVLLKRQKMFSLYSKEKITYYTALWADYLKALKTTGDPRRAGIAHQKLLVTMNIVDREKNIEGPKSAGLAMLRKRISSAYFALGKNLKAKAWFGFDQLSPTTYHTPENLGKHSRSPGTNAFDRPGFSHRYGALDIFGPQGTPIYACFRKKIQSDELSEVERITRNIEKFELKGGEIVDVSRTTSTIDTFSRILSALEIFNKNSSSSKPSVDEIGGLKGNWAGMKSLYGSLYLFNTSSHGGKDNREIRIAISRLLSTLKTIEERILLASGLLEPGKAKQYSGSQKQVFQWLKNVTPYYRLKQTEDWWENYYYKRKLSELMSMKNERARKLMNSYGVFRIDYIKDMLRRACLVHAYASRYTPGVTQKQINASVANCFVISSAVYEHLIYPFKKEARKFAKEQAKLKILAGGSPLSGATNMVALALVEEVFASYQAKLKRDLEILSHKLKTGKKYHTSNKVVIRLDYFDTEGKLKLEGILSYGHLQGVYVRKGNKIENDTAINIGAIGTTGASSVVPHIHLGSWFSIKDAGNNMIIKDQPASPLLFLPSYTANGGLE